MIHHSRQQGFGLIEIIVAIGIMSIAFFGLTQTGLISVRLLRGEKERLQATFLAEEALEATRSVRDASWATIASFTNGTSYYPVIANGVWTLSAVSPGMVDGAFTRSITFAPVYRDAQDRIAAVGTLDPDTKKVTALVSWTDRSPQQITLVTYLANFQQFLSRPTESVAVSYVGAATDADLTSFPSENAGDGDPAQSFTAPAQAVSASAVDLYLRAATLNASDLFAELRASPTGAVIGTSYTVTASTISSTTPAWVRFQFTKTISLQASGSYVIRLRSQPDSTVSGSGSRGNVHWVYTQSASSPYAGGVARRYVGRLGNPNDTGQQLDQYDFGFRVYQVN